MKMDDSVLNTVVPYRVIKRPARDTRFLRRKNVVG